MRSLTFENAQPISGPVRLLQAAMATGNLITLGASRKPELVKLRPLGVGPLVKVDSELPGDHAALADGIAVW